MTIYNKSNGGSPLHLNRSEHFVASGGEGEVYAIPLSDGRKIAVKIFSQRKIQEQGGFLERKLTDMVKKGKEDNNALIEFPKIAWPRIVAYNGEGKFIGYGMRLAKGKPLNYLAHTKLYEDYFPDMDRDKVARMLIDVWQSADFLHERNICLGDINPTNILCTENYGICWIDADSFQIEKSDKSGKWRCLVGRAEMTPQEHMGKDFKNFDRTRQSDWFSLAVLTFQCLMLGRHPYEHIGADSPLENMRKGHFPYATGGAYPGMHGGIPPGPWHKIWSHYTYNLKELFVRTFKESARDPSKRPSADEWVRGLRNYLRTLNSDTPAQTADGKDFWHAREMIPAEEKPQLKKPVWAED